MALEIKMTKNGGCRLLFDIESNHAIIKREKTIIDLTQKEMAQISIEHERTKLIDEIKNYLSYVNSDALQIYAAKYDDSGNAVPQLADKVREIRLEKEHSHDITKAIEELIKD